MITYEKLFELLKEKGLNKAWLRNNGVLPKTVDHLVKNQTVKTDTIAKLCELLECQPGDIMTYTPEKYS